MKDYNIYDENGELQKAKEMGNYSAVSSRLGVGWGFDIPSVQIQPGTAIPLFLHLGVENTYAVDLTTETGLSGMTTTDYMFIKHYPTSSYTLKHKSGITHYFDQYGRIIKTTNSFGDMIEYTWSVLTGEYLNEVSWLEKVVDSLNRQITFDYSISGYTIVTVTSLQTPYQIKYKTQILTTPPDENYETYRPTVLARVEYPENINIDYNYSCDIAKYGKVIGYFMNLTSVTNPYGGRSNYVYNATPVDSNFDGVPEHFMVCTRYDQIGEKYQNYTTLEYSKNTTEEITTVCYYGDNTSSLPYPSPSYAKKEIFTYDYETKLNTKIVTEIPGEDCINMEEKIFKYYNKLPEYITVNKSASGTTISQVKTNIDYDENGSFLKSSDTLGRVEESSSSIIILPSGVKKEVLNWTRKQINPVGTGKLEFSEQSYTYDSYGNVLTMTEKELTNGTYTSVTESMLSNRTLDADNRVWFMHTPKGSSAIEMSYDWFAGAWSDVDVEIRFWVEGTNRPTTITSSNGWKTEHAGGWFVSKTGSNTTPRLVLNPENRYIVEVSCPNNGYFTVKSFNLTYNKLSYTENIKATTYYHYTTPATFGSPDIVHKSFGTANHSSTWSGDGCMITKYEYDNCIVTYQEDNYWVLSHKNLYPTKISQYYIDVDGTGKWEESELMYNHFGQTFRVKKDGMHKTYFYDGVNRLKQETIHANRDLSTNYTYSTSADARGYFYTTVDHQGEYNQGANQHITRYYYNRLGQPVETQKGPLTAPITIEKIEYDGFGRKKSIEDGIGVKTVFEYDGNGRVTRTSLVDKDGKETTYKKLAYHDGNRTITEEVFLKQDVAMGFDKLIGKTVQYLYKTGDVQYIDQYPDVNNQSQYYRTQYTYNLAGQVTSVTNPNNIRIRYSYDYFGVSKVDYPSNDNTYLSGIRKDDEYIYEYSGRMQHVLTKVGDNSYSTTYYDDLGRLKKVIYPDGRTLKNYYDFIGRLKKTSLTSSTQSAIIEYEYDVTGNVRRATHTYDGQGAYEFNYTYDEKGNLTGITYPDGYLVTYTYDQYGRVNAIPGFVLNASYLNNGFITSVSYRTEQYLDIELPDPNPNPLAISPISLNSRELYPVPVTTDYTPDVLGRINSIKNSYMDYSYEYDVTGNITTITGWDKYTGTTNYSYDYNDLGWLTNASHGGTSYVYNYDKAGNRTSQIVNGTTTSYIYDPTQLNILKQIKIGSTYYDIFHDDWGNMSERRDKNLVFSYDNSNQVISVSKKGRAIQNNFYNSEGKRYKKVENGKETYYYYSGETLLYEESSDGTKVNYIYLNGKQIAKVETKNGVQSKCYYFTDHLGSTRAMIGYDGKLIGTVYYEPFGDEKPYYPGRDSSYPNQTSMESTGDITGRLSGTLELTTDRIEGEYALLAKIGDDPYDFTNLSLASQYQGTMDTEDARYYHIWAKPEAESSWIYFAASDDDDATTSFEHLSPDDNEMRYRVDKELQPNAWNLILLDMREGTGDGVDRNTTYLKMFTDEYSQWKWDYFGVSVKDPVTYTGKQQDDTTGLYYFNARYYDPDLGRFIAEDPIRDGANWYVYCENNPLKYVDPSGKANIPSSFPLQLRSISSQPFIYQTDALSFIEGGKIRWELYLSQKSNSSKDISLGIDSIQFIFGVESIAKLLSKKIPIIGPTATLLSMAVEYDNDTTLERLATINALINTEGSQFYLRKVITHKTIQKMQITKAWSGWEKGWIDIAEGDIITYSVLIVGANISVDIELKKDEYNELSNFTR